VAEGDTILRAARRIDDALAGQLLEVVSPNPRGRAAGTARLDGEVLRGAEARGKHLLLHFTELVLHSHLGMSGAWHVYGRDASWRKAPGAAWVVLRGERSEAVEFGGPTLRILEPDALRRDPILSRLGPDILDRDFDPDAIVRSLRSVQDHAVGEALLDQRLVAGIGNIFKSEACFAAQLNPWQAVGELTEQQLRHVADVAHELMVAAAQDGRADRAVYRRAGQPCPRCATPIRSRGQGDANRTTYWCPTCQSPR
jgi:endonuclease VIII